MEQATRILIVLLLISVVKAEKKECNGGTKERSWEAKLQEDLLCDYRYYGVLRNRSEIVKVNMHIIGKYFRFDYYEETLQIFAWVMLSWIDNHLTWKPEEYGDIKKLILSEPQIWIPELYLLNPAEPEVFSFTNSFFTSAVEINSSGAISALFRLNFNSLCKTDVSHWPYDKQNCTLKFGSYDASNKVKFSSVSISMLGAEETMGWTVNDYEFNKIHDSNSSGQVALSWSFERISSGLEALAVFPVYTLAVFTLISLLVNVKDSVRIFLLTLIISCQWDCLSTISEQLPGFKNSIPLVLIFCKCSLIITVLCLLFTFYVSFIMDFQSTSSYVLKFNDLFTKSYLKYVVISNLFLTSSDDTTTLSEEISSNLTNVKEWNTFANIISDIFNVIILMVYVGLMLSCLPKI